MQSFFFFFLLLSTNPQFDSFFFVFGHFRHVGFDSAIKFNLITITLVRRCHVKTTKARSGRSRQSRKRNVRHIPLSHIQLISAQTQTHTHTHQAFPWGGWTSWVSVSLWWDCHWRRVYLSMKRQNQTYAAILFHRVKHYVIIGFYIYMC